MTNPTLQAKIAAILSLFIEDQNYYGNGEFGYTKLDTEEAIIAAITDCLPEEDTQIYMTQVYAKKKAGWNAYRTALLDRINQNGDK